MLGSQHYRFRSRINNNCSRCGHFATSVVGSDFVFLEEQVNSAGQRLDNLIFPFHHGGQVKSNTFDNDTVMIESKLGIVVNVARFEQGFARDTSNAKACSAKLGVFINTGRIHPKLGSTDGSHVSSWPSSEYNYIMFLNFHWYRAFFWNRFVGIFRLQSLAFEP
jgi:hypothetical protein